MANTKKKGTGKSNTRKRAASKTKRNRRSTEQIKRTLDIWLICSLMVAIFLMLCNFGILGPVGNAFSGVMFALFGTMAYIFPLYMLFVIWFAALMYGDEKVVPVTVEVSVIYICLCIISQFIYKSEVDDYFFWELMTTCAKERIGGGLFGGEFYLAFSKLFTDVGGVIITATIIVAMLALLFSASIVRWISDYREGSDDREEEREQYRKYREQIRQNKSQAREEREKQRQAERIERKRREAMRTAPKYTGVDFNELTIGDNNKESQIEDMHEIKGRKINIEGIEPSFSGHVDIADEPYTYYEDDKNSGRLNGVINNKGNNNRNNSIQNIKKTDWNKTPQDSGVININITGHDMAEEEEDHSTDGEFTPKERIEVSESAKRTMARNPYSKTTLSPASVTATVGDANDMIERPTADTSQTPDVEIKPAQPAKKKKMRYIRPRTDQLLTKNPGSAHGTSKEELLETAGKLQMILKQFGVNVTVTNVSRGPSVTRYELQPEIGTKVSKITSLTDDIKLNLAASDIRIEAPIPGKAAVGIEVPNKGRDTVYIRDLIESKELKENKSKIAFAAGKDISGKVIVADIAKMPHMLVAGTTGSGKSVFTNSIIMSILYRATPDEVKLLIVDPKVVEFGIYNGIPHLITPVITDPKKAAGALNWAVAEMSDRYKKFAATGTRDLKGYNETIENGEYEGDEKPEKLPQIVIIIDELADLMMVAAKDVEDAICRLAQLARAAGIHLVIATQRPSVDVVTGLIKANIPSRVALLVSSGTDSRTIIDMNGAEKLLGNGDMLFYPSGYVKPVRLQGAFVSDDEVKNTVEFLKNNCGEVEYNDAVNTAMVADSEEGEEGGTDGRDAYFVEAGRLVIEKQKGSTSMIQRSFRVGFNRAARIMEQLYDAGVVGQEETNKPRRVLMTLDEFDERFS